MISGTQGYAEQAQELIERYEATPFVDKHRAELHVLPPTPRLASVLARRQRFNAVMLTAVWMHLDESERRVGMPVLASLLAPDGVLVMSLRHGPVPAGRRMFAVSGEETIALAKDCGLQTILNTHTESVGPVNRAAGITWTRLAFRPSV